MSQVAVFADTTFYIAMVNPRDALHEKAMAFAKTFHGKTYTSQYVLIEAGNWLCKSGDKRIFVELMAEIRADPDTIVAPGNDQLFGGTLSLYAKRLDKEWSFTDCSSFFLMETIRLSEALTADRHFTQAGFKTLLG